MKKTKTLLCLALSVFINFHVFAQATTLPAPFGPHPWTVAVKVIGEDGNPITGVDVAVSYDVPATPEGNQPRYGVVKGITDDSGMFTASHTDSSLGLAVTVNKSGYYTTHIGHQFYFNAKNWYPSFTLVLKQIGSPIPMYAKHEETKLQQEDKPMGFDLTAGDWITPYGKGFHADLFFTVHRKITSATVYDANLTITFPNAGDGIAIAPSEPVTYSAFRTSRTATQTEYQPELVLHYSNTEQPPSIFGYFIRIHTELDQDGKILSTLYGKIPNGFKFYAGTKAPRAGIEFDYYLNPTPNDRNLEFDTKKNLVKDIGEFEGIAQP